MTIISLESNGINGDFELLFADETVGSAAVAGLRMLRRASGATTTVHDTNALYSAVAAAADDFQAMGFTNPMLPTTPNAYTMENGYFIPRSSTEFLFNGSVTSVGWAGGEVISIAYVATVADFVSGDIGRQVTGGTTTDTGTLLDFEVFPDGTLVAWIRPDDPAVDLFDDASETLTATGDGGVGNCTTAAVSLTGEAIFSSIQAIGSVPTTTEVYMVQDRFKMTDSLGTFQWWATDTTVSLGIIDVLTRVQVADTLVDLGNVTLYARRYSSLYDHFTLDVSAGGRSAIPLSSAPDLNNTTGYSFFTGSAGSTVFQVGEVANEAVSLASVVITAVGGTEAAPELAYYIIGDVDVDIFSSGAQTLTGVDSTATCTTAAPVVNLLGPTDPASGEGATVTVNFGTVLADHDGVGGTEPYSITIDAQNNVPVAKVYERIKYLLRRGAGDPFDTPIGMDGEQYKGIQQQAQYSGTTGSGISDGGFLLTVSTGSPPYSARSVSENTGDTYVMLTDRRVAPALVSSDLLEQTSGNSVTITGTPLTVPEIKPSPFGSFTGSQIFGAVGVLYINPGSGDAQNYILLDDNQVVRTPPNTVTISVLNTLAGDRVYAARDTGVAGTINKDQFGGIASAAQSGTVITVAGTVDTEVPTAGFVRIVENALQQEHHYVYDTRVTGASGTFTLRVVNTGSASATSNSTTQLIDTTATFQSAPVVEVGMLVRNTFGGKTTHVWEVTNIVNTTTLDVTPLYGTPDDWDIGDTYEINELIQLYDTGDDLYDLILDVEATTTSASNILVKIPASNFGVVLNVRQGKIILPFTQNGTVGDTGVTLTVVRSDDTIATA